MSGNFRAIKRKSYLATTSVWDKALFPEYTISNFRKRDSVAIYPGLGLLYNRLKKSGNTTITSFLAEIEGGQIYTCNEAKRKYQRPDFFSFSQARTIKHLRLITFVRNPYTRVLSAFRDKIGRGTKSAYRDFPGFGRDNPDGFSDFVYFLETGGLYKDRHWWPQSDLLIAPLYSFFLVGRLENLSTEMSELFARIGIGSEATQKLDIPHVSSSHTTGSAEVQLQYYDDGLRSKVASLYRRDFEQFRYEL